MRYKYNTDAAVTQLTAGFHQLGNLLLAKRRGRLVHNNHFCIDQDCLCNLDHLLNAHAESTGSLGRINILTQRSHDFLCFLVHGFIIQQSARTLDPFVDKNIICNT